MDVENMGRRGTKLEKGRFIETSGGCTRKRGLPAENNKGVVFGKDAEDAGGNGGVLGKGGQNRGIEQSGTGGQHSRVSRQGSTGFTILEDQG